ncbi:putative MFS family arabinose efflux permease [Nocardia transvalensis]|uniref:Putative MFS family arabinose efflux permease n=1 Tax=Nocardia transvalensis TaxID=37333 RepID=A0A7W9PHZ3_9NOCA|nr:MFS transporter [Nocardia transvalensis]MBB5916430.1 putative MFS family arabinose efflux permease [Nocardia transvalensis]
MTEIGTLGAESAPPQHLPARGRLAAGAVAVGTFTVVTSEMLPVGLLTPLGAALGVSEGLAGLALTVTGLLAVTAPVLMAALGRVDRRRLLPVLMLVVAVGNLLCAVAPSFAVLVAGRVLVGAGMGGVWAISGSLAVRLVPPRSVGTATSVIFSGIAIASVLGVPAGTYLGALAGWRSAFGAAAGLAVLVAVALAAILPPLPPERGVALSDLPRLLANPRLRTGMIVVALLVGGHFAAYTYLRPVLEQRVHASAGTVSALLLGYGIAGVAGTFILGTIAARAPRRAVVAVCAGLAAAVGVLALVGGSPLAACLLLVAWGLSYGGVSVSTQTWTSAAAPGAREAASAILVAVFNAAIASGALFGGRAVDGYGPTAALWLGTGLVVLAGFAAAVGSAPHSNHPDQ